MSGARDVHHVDAVLLRARASQGSVDRILKAAVGPWVGRQLPGFPGRFAFQSSEKICKDDVLRLAEAIADESSKYTVLINGGTHGSADGHHTGDPGKLGAEACEFMFVKEDFESLRGLPKEVSALHIVSKLAPPIYPENITFCINAWCWSDSKNMIQPGIKAGLVIMARPKRWAAVADLPCSGSGAFCDRIALGAKVARIQAFYDDSRYVLCRGGLDEGTAAAKASAVVGMVVLCATVLGATGLLPLLVVLRPVHVMEVALAKGQQLKRHQAKL